MTQQLKDQAKQVEQRLRITTHMSDRNGFLIAADTIAALITALEAAEANAARWVKLCGMADDEDVYISFPCTVDGHDFERIVIGQSDLVEMVDAAIAQGAKK